MALTGYHGLEARYAIALFDLAREQNALDAVEKDLSALLDLIRSSPDMQALTRSPLISRKARVQAVEAVAKHAGLSALVRSFLGVVARGGRLDVLPAIIRIFQAIRADHAGEKTVSVKTATPLTSGQEARVRETLEKSLGGRVRLSTSADPGLLGGMVVQTGSTLIDTSLRTRLQRLEHTMKGTA
ncbi:MAG: F0F1 ATP synthase subunit delta [Pseudomonadota bacterium]|nr:F0F1 ATP synthase subunit delta [Pseudomonadota bacterium]